MLKNLVGKITKICTLAVILGCIMFSHVYADEPVVTYSTEYSENTVTLTLYINEINAFDIAAAYDSSKVTVKDIGYTTEFKQLQSQGYTTLSVHNEDAVDDNGNTYAVFVGAGFTSENDPIPFEGKPMATITFEGDVAGTDIHVFTNSADYDDIYQAKSIGVASKKESTGAVVPAQPTQVDGNQNTASNSEKNTVTPNINENKIPDVNSDTADDFASDDLEGNASETKEPTAAPEESEEPKATDEAKTSSSVDKETKSGKAVIYVCVIFVVAVIAAVVIFIILKKKKAADK